jgi:hypothetical protein
MKKDIKEIVVEKTITVKACWSKENFDNEEDWLEFLENFDAGEAISDFLQGEDLGEWLFEDKSKAKITYK